MELQRIADSQRYLGQIHRKVGVFLPKPFDEKSPIVDVQKIPS